MPINLYAESIAVGNRIFVAGGDSPLIDNVYEIDIKTCTLIEKAHLLRKTHHFSLCNANDYIYLVGGELPKESHSSDCEKYSISLNKWTFLPKLLAEEIINAAVFTIKNATLFVIGGYCGKQGGNINSMEKLNILKPTKWEYVTVKNVFSGRTSIQAYPINVNEVIVFGGCTPECYVLTIGDVVECREEVGQMAHLGNFCCTAASVCDGRHIYGVDRAEYSLLLNS